MDGKDRILFHSPNLPTFVTSLQDIEPNISNTMYMAKLDMSILQEHIHMISEFYTRKNFIVLMQVEKMKLL